VVQRAERLVVAVVQFGGEAVREQPVVRGTDRPDQLPRQPGGLRLRQERAHPLVRQRGVNAVIDHR